MEKAKPIPQRLGVGDQFGAFDVNILFMTFHHNPLIQKPMLWAKRTELIFELSKIDTPELFDTAYCLP